MEFNNMAQGLTYLSSLRSSRDEEQGCDVILKVADLSVPAHRVILSACSPYFSGMFNGLFPESFQKTVILQDLDPSSVDKLVNYMYTGRIEINSDNVQNLLITSDFFQIPWVQERCCDFLMKSLDSSNCLEIRRLSEKLSCKVLEEKAEIFAVEAFSQVVNDEEFLQLSIGEVKRMFSYPEIYNHSDDIIFYGIVRWAGHIPEERKKYLNDLLTYVHPALVSKDLVKKSTILTEDTSCTEWLSKTMDNVETEWNIFVLDLTAKFSHLHRYGMKTEKQIPLAKLPERALAPSVCGQTHTLYVQGGTIDRKYTTKSFRYNIYRDTWKPFIPLKIPRALHKSCVLNSSIYAIGGRGYDGRMSSVERLDLDTGEVFDVERMVYDRDSMGAVVYENCIYVMGGENINASGSMERYDPRMGNWEELARMNNFIGYCNSTIVADSIYCYEGLEHRMERYDFRMNSWNNIESNNDWDYCRLFSIDNELYSLSEGFLLKYCFEENSWNILLQFSSFGEWAAIPLEMQV